jgi:uncharacterized protein (TIGR03067 family)
MVNLLLRIPLLIVTATCFGCSKAPAPVGDPIAREPAAAAIDQAKFQGSWKYLSLHHRGKPTAPSVVSEYVFCFEGSHYTTSRGGKVQSQGTFRIDPAKTPSFIDLLESTGVRVYAVYHFDGDKLTICMDDYERPADFNSQGGKSRSLVVLERLGSTP